ncbi:MAG TPA: LysR family transcriptional regulator [Burkholderiales bacterium]|nr:LysR family transcriptional regulator [Burkholderiales bacterium]
MAQPRITLEQWQALVAVVEAGSHAKAAEVLHKTQSTITYAVQKVESLLGVKAFEIRGRKAVLTPTGQLLYRRAKVLLEEAAGVETAARRLSAGWEAELRITVEHVFPNAVMFKCLERFAAESPHTHIELVETVLAGAESLARAQVDLAILHAIPSGFFGEPLIRMRFLLVAHPAHPLHQLGRPVTQNDLRANRHLVVRESSSARTTRLTLEATQRWTVSHMATSIMAARSGYGFAWLPEERIREELAAGTLAVLPLREGGERYVQLYLVFADRDVAGPGAVRLAEILRQTTAEMCAAEEARTTNSR